MPYRCVRGLPRLRLPVGYPALACADGGINVQRRSAKVLELTGNKAKARAIDATRAGNFTVPASAPGWPPPQ